MNYSNKQVVVTGAGGGLGRVLVARLEELGAKVVKLDVAFPPESTGNCQVVDLTSLEDTKKCFAGIGRVDAVFNIAGGFAMGMETWDESDEQWDAMFIINVKTLRNSLKAVVPIMLKQGRGSIVNVGAYGALSGAGAMSAYCASKSTVMRLTESLSEEVKAKGINVNAVLPTIIDTPANRAGMPDADPAAWVAPSDLANVLCFLGSEDAKAVHGALVPVRSLS